MHDLKGATQLGLNKVTMKKNPYLSRFGKLSKSGI